MLLHPLPHEANPGVHLKHEVKHNFHPLENPLVFSDHFSKQLNKPVFDLAGNVLAVRCSL